MTNYNTARLGAMLAGAMFSAIALSAGVAQAAKLGPYFPLPLNLSASSVTRESLLSAQAKWLENGLDNLKKARASAQGDDKIKELDALIADTEKELAIAKDESASKDVQTERKRQFLLNFNQWINELNHQATEQMKIAIMKDGAEAMAGTNAAARYSEIADALERAKQDPSFENWGK